HEDVSVEMATHFLQGQGVSETMIQRVTSCIKATRMPQSPVNLIEKILCDADLYHLSTEDFKARNQLLKQEREMTLNQKINKKEWRKGNIEFLRNHTYFTEFGQEVLEPKKLENLALLQKKKDGGKAADQEPTGPAFPYIANLEKHQKDAKDTEKGIQTMFRTTSHNHLELSGMADSKAHILITVNTIIITGSVSFLGPKLRFDPDFAPFIIPTAILILTCLISITCSILATRPSISSGKFTEEDIRNRKTNLLFFGNFHQMQLQDYQWGMSQMMQDKSYLYNTMIMDIYFLGVVLARKYKYLRTAYTIFMVGLIITVIAFGITWLTMGSHNTQQTPVMDY
ncbi:MAG TPA: Pycsar system effector family protein, partial [Flavisolibacter sp.]|nr:Pycsar system effector family protein [Flavisolibacter sp.]